MRGQLIIMLKDPRPGRVKTRLGQDIGMTTAAWWFRHQCRNLIRRMQDPRWNLVLAVTPDSGGLASRFWPAHLPRLPQGAGDLGARMTRIFRSLPPGPAVIVGADIPKIRQHHINRAFRALGDHDAVLGPATDGGYWLIGLKQPNKLPSDFLSNIRWSGPHALKDTCAALGHRRFAIIDTLPDVDTADDLECRP